MQSPWEIFVWPVFAAIVAVLLSLLSYFGADLGWSRFVHFLRPAHSPGGQFTDIEAGIREETLRSVSLELHDRVGHILTMALLHLEKHQGCASHAPPPVPVVQNLLKQALEAVRHISSSYSAEEIQLSGLTKAIKKELEFLESAAQFSTHISIKGDPVFLDDRIETTIFRIFQEIVTNIIRHAHACRLMVLLEYSASELILLVIDDGRGFEPGRQLNRNLTKGSGLSNIIRRTRSLGGVPIISSEPGKGTRIRISIPLKK